MRSLFVLLTFMLVTVPSFAQDRPVTKSTWGSVKAMYHRTEMASPVLTPKIAAEALKAGQVSEDMMTAITNQPVEFQMELAKQLWVADGIDSSQAAHQADDLRLELGLNRHASQLSSAAESCDQSIEYKTVVRDPVWAYMTTSFSSSRGTEYLYHFNPWWSASPDKIRWAATDPRVYWAVWFRTWNSGIAGSGLCSKPFRLMLGNNVISLAGGQYGVMANLYVHHD